MTDFEKHILDLSLHFIRKGYPKERILDAAILSRRLDPDPLLHKNWDIHRQRSHTEYMYKKKLVIGYKRPKNLRDKLVN